MVAAASEMPSAGLSQCHTQTVFMQGCQYKYAHKQLSSSEIVQDEEGDSFFH